MTVTNAAKYGATPTTVAYPPKGVIYVKNSTTTCGSSNPPITARVQRARRLRAALRQRTYTKCLTLASENDIIIRAPDYTNNADLKRDGDVVMGLIANNYVRVAHRVNRTSSSCTQRRTRRSTRSSSNVTVEAAILSLKHSFIVDNWNCGAKLGALTVTGAIAQKFRGPVGTGGTSAGGTGFQKIYNYDDRLRYRSPPYFLDPVASAWGVIRSNEQVPADEMSVPPPAHRPEAPRRRRAAVRARRRLEEPRGWGRRSAVPAGVLRFSPGGPRDRARRGARASRCELPLATLALAHGRPGPGARRRRSPAGSRSCAGCRAPRSSRARTGIEGWLWTSRGGSALPSLARDDAPNGALLFTKPLAGELVTQHFAPEWVAALAARSPLGDPVVLGLLLRLADTHRRRARSSGATGSRCPLTDREVPPAMRRVAADRRPGRPAPAPLGRGSARRDLGRAARHGLRLACANVPAP